VSGDPPVRTFQDDRLEHALQVSQRLDDVELAKFIEKNRDLSSYDLAAAIIRDFFGQLDVAYLFDELRKAGL
jgi:hypothetical protein